MSSTEIATPKVSAAPTNAARYRRLVEFVGRRIIAFVALMLGISLIAFILTHLVPTDPAVAALGEVGAGNPAAVAAFRKKYGLDDPLPVQYASYLWQLLHGDLGNSFRTGTPVMYELGRAIPATLELASLAIVIVVLAGLTLGTLAAVYKDGAVDQLVRVVTLGGISMPTFWLGLMLYYIFFFRLGWAPPGGRLDPIMSPPPAFTGLFTVDALIAGDWEVFWSAVSHLILPAMVVAASSVCVVARFTRTSVLEVLQSEHVTVARAKGLPERVVVLRYVLRAALVPIVTLLGVCFGHLLAGAVLTEHIFSWPGVGQLAFQSAANLDVNAIMGVCLFVGIAYVTVNFLVDIVYGIIDPRIRVA